MVTIIGTITITINIFSCTVIFVATITNNANSMSTEEVSLTWLPWGKPPGRCCSVGWCLPRPQSRSSLLRIKDYLGSEDRGDIGGDEDFKSNRRHWVDDYIDDNQVILMLTQETITRIKISAMTKMVMPHKICEQNLPVKGGNPLWGRGKPSVLVVDRGNQNWGVLVLIKIENILEHNNHDLYDCKYFWVW